MRGIDVKLFKKAMIDADIDSYTKVEELTGVNRSTLTNLLKGEQKPSYDTIERIADVFHLKYGEIGAIFFANELTGRQEKSKGDN